MAGLEGVEHGEVLGVPLHGGVEALARLLGLLGERPEGDREPGRALELAEQGERTGVVRARVAAHVVGDLRPEPERRDAQLVAAALQHGLHAGGHVEGAAEQAGDRCQLGRGRGDRHRDRAGVGDRGRVGAQADDHAGAEPLGQVERGLGEGPPRVVGLGAEQEQQVVAGFVDAGAQLEARPRQTGVHAVDQVHHGPAGAVIEQGVRVERGHGVRVDAAEQRLGGGGGGVPRVDPALEDHDHDGVLERRLVVEFVQHRDQASIRSRASSDALPRSRTVSPNASASAPSSPMAPAL